MSKKIRENVTKYVTHKIETLIERVYIAIMDKIFDAENYDEFEMDDENNIYITYCLKKDENIISDAHNLIQEQILKKYRKKLEERLEEEGFFVEYDESDMHVYFEEPLKTDNKSDLSSIDHNILIYKKNNTVVKGENLTGLSDSNLFNFGCDDDDD